jgi:hypothetical protein
MKIKKPVFIIGCPRSGTTLLYTILKSTNQFWASHSEAHFVWEKFVPDARDPMYAVYLTEENYSPEDDKYLNDKYSERVYQHDVLGNISQYAFYNKFRKIMSPFYAAWRAFLRITRKMIPGAYRVLDKTPPNTYRVRYLAKAFPDAKFIYITRHAATNISSLIEGWKSTGRFNFKFREFYPENKEMDIKGYEGNVWKFTHAPGWKEYLKKPLEEICAFQWESAHKYSLEAFDMMDDSRFMQIKYEVLIANPPEAIQNICKFADIEYDSAIKKNCENLPIVSTNTKPDPKKWLKNRDLILNIADKVNEMNIKLGYDKIEAEVDSPEKVAS